MFIRTSVIDFFVSDIYTKKQETAIMKIVARQSYCLSWKKDVDFIETPFGDSLYCILIVQVIFIMAKLCLF